MGSPEVTAYDLRFRLFHIPVRVHPLFWLFMLMISGQSDDLQAAAVFVVCAFISILVHEFGHGLSSRLLGQEPIGIVLYAMGGFCAFEPGRISPIRRFFVLFCGPGAGFLLLGLVLGCRYSFGMPESLVAQEAFGDLVFINLIWGILNLFPLWPLDGGQMLGVLFGMASPSHGMRWAHVISLLAAGALAVLAFTYNQWFMAFWFAYFGYINYQVLQTLHTASRFADDGEWWRQ